VRILFSMTYYRPYVNGPIIYVETLGEELVRRGHTITVLTSRHDPASPAEEVSNGIRIVRLPVAARVSKGVLTPRLPLAAWELIRSHDAVFVQVPQLEAPLLTLLGKFSRVPAVLTYHCDVELPNGLLNWLVSRTLRLSTVTAARTASRIVAYTEDYALHSQIISRFGDKVDVVPPPVTMPLAAAEDIESFRNRHGLTGSKVIGVCGRVSTEKGLETLMKALPFLVRHYPNLRILHAGETRHVMGESDYAARVNNNVREFADRWISLGVLERRQLPAFYGACDVTVLPSVNRTESFGLVQVESMLCGTPVVASELPGVRMPTRVTGMGMTVKPGDPEALADALLEILREPQRFWMPRQAVEAKYSVRQTADGYEALLARLRG